MEAIRLEIPENLAKDLKAKDSKYICHLIDLGIKQQKMEEALILLKKGDVSIGYAAQVAGVSVDEMSSFAYAKGLAPSFSQETLKEELGK